MNQSFELKKIFPIELINCIVGLLKDPGKINEVCSVAYQNRNARDLVVALGAEESVTGKPLALIVSRDHLLSETEYNPEGWNAWPDTIPPRLNTEPKIDGKFQECDYWLLKMKNGRFITGKFTRQQYWVQVPENQIAAYRQFSPLPGIAELGTQEALRTDGWNAYPKFVPSAQNAYEVILKDGRQRVVTWKPDDASWSFYPDEIIAFKAIK